MRELFAQLGSIPTNQDFMYNGQRYRFSYAPKVIDEDGSIENVEVIEVMIDGSWVESPTFLAIEFKGGITPVAKLPALGSVYWYWRKPALSNEIIRKMVHAQQLSLSPQEWALNNKTNEGDLLDEYNFLSGNFFLTQEEGNQDYRKIREGLDQLRKSWWGVTGK